jgi:hypothetical protein
MANKFVRVTIDIELEKDVPDLVSHVASRAHTIQGVRNAYDFGVIDIMGPGMGKIILKPSICQRISDIVWGWFGK